jgi:hypothetical protein
LLAHGYQSWIESVKSWVSSRAPVGRGRVWLLGVGGVCLLRALGHRRQCSRRRRVMVLSELECEYSVRSTPSALAKQYFLYGFWRARTIRSHRSAARLRHAAPLILLVALLASLVAILLGSEYGYVVPGAYLLATLISGAKVLISERTMNALIAPAVFAIIHRSFGFGLATGVVRWLFSPERRHESYVK